jgi:hypothetical protein
MVTITITITDSPLEQEVEGRKGGDSSQRGRVSDGKKPKKHLHTS